MATAQDSSVRAGEVLVTGGLMLAYRVILPIMSSLTHRFTVSRVVPVGPDAVSIEVTGRKVRELEARGGRGGRG